MCGFCIKPPLPEFGKNGVNRPHIGVAVLVEFESTLDEGAAPSPSYCTTLLIALHPLLPLLRQNSLNYDWRAGEKRQAIVCPL